MKNLTFYRYLCALLLFGSNGIVASLIALDSQQIVLLRTLLGSLLLLALFFLTGNRLTCGRKKRPLAFLVLSGMAMGASWMCLYEAYARVGVGIASLLYYCGPVLVMLSAPFLFHEKLTAGSVIGFLAVLGGIVLVNGNADGGGDRFGFLCGACSAVLYALMVICNKKAAAITGLENAALQLLVSFLTVAAVVGLKGGYPTSLPASCILPILMLGLLNTGVGCYLYFSSIGCLPVRTVAVCGYLEPLSAVTLSLLLLRETMLPPQLIGAVLILGGALFCELSARRQDTPRRFPHTQ